MPTDTELTVLTDYLGGFLVAGGKMKSTGTQYWQSPNSAATNESGFSGLPGSYRNQINGNFDYVGDVGYCWSSTEVGSNSAWFRTLSYSSGITSRTSLDRQIGFSVRCLKD